MTCPQCHTGNKAGRKFCAVCGQVLPHACEQCGFLNDASDRFCGGCGTALAALPRADGSVTVAPPLPQPPTVYTPSYLAERIRAIPLTDGERKTITVLFADLKGSTALIEGLDPEDARALIDPALQLMMDAVHRYEGYVAQALGDGIFALFGAPIAHEDHAQRALYAALRMQDEMHRYSDQIRLTHGVALTMRVGVNTGEVVVRSIRKDDVHTDYVPVGHAINLAARMEQMATPGSIVITEETQKLVTGYFDLKALGAATIKGSTEPLPVYEILGTGPVRTRLQVSAHRGFTRFVGRQEHLAQLQTALHQAKAGNGQIVGVRGEPGVGKSRLLHEFKRLCPQECIVLETAAVAHGAHTPYLPVIELLQAYVELQPYDDARTRRARLFGKVLSLDRGLEDALPYLSALLDIEEPTSSLQEMDPPAVQHGMNNALTRLWLAESRQRPLVIICEDLHWVDRATQAFLEVLSEHLAAAPVILLVNYRPEYQPAWRSKSYFTEVQLNALGASEKDEFLTLLLGVDDSLTDLKQQILTTTEGTPFFMEEVVQALVDEQRLHGQRGNYRLTQPVIDLRIPRTVQGVLAARIDRLAPAEKALLQQLAVIGRECPLALARQVLSDTPSDWYQHLTALQHKEFLFEQLKLPDVEYVFTHALTHEVAYNSMLIERRKVLHQQTAEAIEHLFHQQLDEHYAVLAHHYSNSGNIEKAIHYMLKDFRTAWFDATLREFGTSA